MNGDRGIDQQEVQEGIWILLSGFTDSNWKSESSLAKTFIRFTEWNMTKHVTNTINKYLQSFFVKNKLILQSSESSKNSYIKIVNRWDARNERKDGRLCNEKFFQRFAL